MQNTLFIHTNTQSRITLTQADMVFMLHATKAPDLLLLPGWILLPDPAQTNIGSIGLDDS